MKTAVRRVREPARIVGRVVRLSDGIEVFFVTSQSQPGKLYRVEVLRSRLTCRCLASLYTGNCAHRKAVHAVLDAEMAAKKTQRNVVTITVMSRETASEAADERDTALMRRSNRPFSIMA